MAGKSYTNIFVSSTSIDLEPYRTKARDAILSFGLQPVMMEYWPAMDASAVQACIDAVDRSDVYVGVFAHRYGFCPAGSDLSITEMEFDRATARGIPRLCFLIDESTPWPPEHIEQEPGQAKLRAFKARLNATLVRKTFSTPESLKSAILMSLQGLTNKEGVPDKTPTPMPPGSPVALPPQSGPPFVLGRPLRPTERIFGRDEALKFIGRQLANFGNVNVVGERRMGKSSVLNHLIGHQSEYIPARPDQPPVVLARVDLQGLSTAAQFFGHALRELLAHLPDSRSAEASQFAEQRRQLEQKPEITYEQFEAMLRRLRDKGRICILPVIVVDEFEQLLEESAAQGFPYPEFFDRLSALKTADLLAMVIASRCELKEYFNDPGRPKGWTSKFPRYFPPCTLERLSDTDAEALLLQKSDHPLTLQEARLARQWAAGHPCHLQAAGAAWYEAKASGHPARWASNRFETLKGSTCIEGATNNARRPGTRRGPRRLITRLLWTIPFSIGRLAQRLGVKIDDVAAWIIGAVVIIVCVFALMNIVQGTEVWQVIKKGLGLP
jgi:hypothetical protein